MQTSLPTQAAPAVPAAPESQPQMVEGTTSFTVPRDMWQAGEEAARAIARLRHRAVDNWDQVAHFTQAALAENGLSYREQEGHTGVGASTVYRMALGNTVGVRAVQQFAAFAAYHSRCEETRVFWTATLSRLAPEETSTGNPTTAPHGSIDPAIADPEEIAVLYSRLLDTASRKAVTDLLRSLQTSEAER